MRDENHLSEEMLNMYLDGELSKGERDCVETHLATCEACCSELLELQTLFGALDELAPAPAPNLVPGVLDQIRPRRKVAELWPWSIPALQTATALTLLVWGWTRLVGYWGIAVDTVSFARPRDTWTWVSGWAAERWTALYGWLDVGRFEFQRWSIRLPTFSGLHLSPTQLAVLCALLAALWLVGNAVLLRRALLNGQEVDKEALG
jgi:hypothetical protein